MLIRLDLQKCFLGVVSKILKSVENETLDEGEKEAISLAHELSTTILLEEAKGRRFARSKGLVVSGIAGIIGKSLFP